MKPAPDGFYDVTPRPLKPFTPSQIRLALSSVAHEERQTVRYLLLNMPSKRGLNACARYIEERGTTLSATSTYCLYRALAWVSGEPDGTSNDNAGGEQLCIL